MNYVDDTIVAIASGCTQSGISVIRISGEQALSIVNKIFKPAKQNVDLNKMKTYTAHYGNIINPDSKEIIDECIILYMKGPSSYTGEDIVEVDVHGGMYVTNKVLELICQMGARLADPGEYTKRAFLNGRMDLTQAEAVMDVIESDNKNALSVSMKQLNGDLKNAIVEIRKNLIHENAYIEYALDDPEHVSLDGFSEKLSSIIDNSINKIKSLLEHYREGRIVKDGLKTAIVGKPNAGKSSLLNVLLGENRAIVTNVPGTTRDTLEERVVLKGIPLNIIDTAGIRNTEDIVEKIGVEKSKQIILDADLILYIIDQSSSLTEEDDMIISLIKNKKCIVLLNKNDLEQCISTEMIERKINVPIISVSMINKSGIEEFVNILKKLFFNGNITINNEITVSNERQKNSLINALNSLKQVRKSIQDNMPEDFYTIDILDAYEQLGLIIGESVNDDLVNEIFAEFCIGK